MIQATQNLTARLTIRFALANGMPRAIAAALLVLGVNALSLPQAQANLIVNGSFEQVDEQYRKKRYGSSNTWQIYSELPGWNATRNMEVWKSGFKRVAAADGRRFIELNAHPRGASSFTIAQDFNTESGVIYDLSFFARKRSRGTESFEVSVGDLLASVSTHVKREWTEFQFKFTGDGGSTRLSFTSLDGGRDTVGNFIDDIRVTAAVPEANVLSLIAIGLVGIGVSRLQPRRR